MCAAVDTNSSDSTEWSVLAKHDWDGPKELCWSLVDALQTLSENEEVVLYDYIDVSVLDEAFRPKTPGKGATKFVFQYDCYEIRVADDGTIAAREC